MSNGSFPKSELSDALRIFNINDIIVYDIMSILYYIQDIVIIIYGTIDICIICMMRISICYLKDA